MSSSVANGLGTGTHTNKPKLTFKFKSPVTTLVPDDFLATTWATLSDAIKCMRERRSSDVTFEELYRLVEDTTLHNKSSELLNLIRTNVRDRSIELISNFETSKKTDPDALLLCVASTWRSYVDETRMLRQIFTHLERWCTKANGAATTIYDVAIEEFKSQCSKSLVDAIVDAVLNVVEHERRAQAQDWLNKNAGLAASIDSSSSISSSFTTDYHHEAVRMLIALHPLYSNVFEPRFLETSKNYLETEALERLRASSNLDDYLLYAASRLAQESSRPYLAMGTKRPLLKIAETCFHADCAQQMCVMGLEPLISSSTPNSLQVLSRLYNALKSSDALIHLRTGFTSFIRGRGAMIVVSGAADTIPQLVELSSRTDKQVKESFGGDETLARAARDSCEYYMNLDEHNKAAELLAKYMDRTLRVATRESDAETELDRAMSLFRAVHSKDVFEEFYKQALGKRLILGTSSSDDLERMMISKLKTECGAGFTNKLEGMFRDIDLSNTLVQEWRTSRTNNPPIESQVYILSTGHWPSYPEHKSVRLTPELDKERLAFEDFYATKFQKGRVVTWRHALVHCTIKALIGSSKYELEMSLFQALVLLRLQASSKTFSQLLEETGIPLIELETTLISISVAKKEQRLLTWTKANATSAAPVVEETGMESDDEEGGKGVEATTTTSSSITPQPTTVSKAKPGEKFRSDDVFAVDPKWSSKRSRFKINQIQLQETKKEIDDAHERVAQERHHQIDAAIVRIMKSRKRLTHLVLMTELFAHLSFPAKPQDVKKRIESLIEREYLERVADSPNEYEYLA